MACHRSVRPCRHADVRPCGDQDKGQDLSVNHMVLVDHRTLQASYHHPSWEGATWGDDHLGQPGEEATLSVHERKVLDHPDDGHRARSYRHDYTYHPAHSVHHDYSGRPGSGHRGDRHGTYHLDDRHGGRHDGNCRDLREPAEL